MCVKSSPVIWSRKKMSASLVLFLSLIATSQVTVSAYSTCSFQKGRTVLCYGSMGHPVFLQVGNFTKDKEITIHIEDKRILKYKNGNSSLTYNWSQFFENGTLRLDRALKTSSQTYKLSVHNKNGKLLEKSTIQLIYQAPLSEPVISLLCLPHGEVRASCSANSEVAAYSWALGNKPLDASVAYMKDGRVILEKNVSTNITCTVSNHVSRNFTTVRLPACQAPRFCTLADKTEVSVSVKTADDFLPLFIIKEILISVDGRENTTVVCNNSLNERKREKNNPETDRTTICVEITTLFVAAGVVIALFAVIAVVRCLCRRRTRAEMPDEGENKTQEVVYTEVVGLHRKEEVRAKEKRKQPKTVYEQVKFIEIPEHLAVAGEGQEDVVYAKVRK